MSVTKVSSSEALETPPCSGLIAEASIPEEPREKDRMLESGQGALGDWRFCCHDVRGEK